MDKSSFDKLSFIPHNLLYTEEPLEQYQYGGLHPVCLEDKFKDGRYQVRHKLGWGASSTVWLARDHILDIWVALKITRADALQPSHELQVLKPLHQKRARNIVQVLDWFIHNGPNGSHQCLVLELLGPTLNDIVGDYIGILMDGDLLDAETMLRITRQLLKAMVSIHGAGYAHGNISGLDVVFTSRKLARSSAKTIFKALGNPYSEKLAYCDGKPLLPGMPKQLVEASEWDGWIEEDDEDIRIIDLGEAFTQDVEPVTFDEPGTTQAPERIFTGKVDYRVDLWWVGYTIYTMVFGRLPFYGGEVGCRVKQMIGFVDDLPIEWRAEWERIKINTRFDGEDEWDNILNRRPSKLEEKFQKKDFDASLAPLLPIMQGLMRFRPSDRISAVEALRLLNV